MRMTAVGFRFVANIIRTYVPADVRDECINAVARDLATFNPRCDRRQFVAAARGPVDPPVPMTRTQSAEISALIDGDPWRAGFAETDSHWTSTSSDGEVAVRISVPKQEGEAE